jgi:hypothetical protein
MKKLIISFLLIVLVFLANAQDTKVNVLQGLESSQSHNQDTKLTATLNKATRLFGVKEDITTVIMIIPSGEVVDVLGSDSTYFHVAYQDSEGYILRRHATLNNVTTQVSPAVQQQANVQEEQPIQRQQISRFSYLENKYGTSMAASLIAGKIWKGMTTEMVQDSWGTPKKISRFISGNIVKEEWIFNNSWLFFENEILTDWGPVKEQ